MLPCVRSDSPASASPSILGTIEPSLHDWRRTGSGHRERRSGDEKTGPHRDCGHKGNIASTSLRQLERSKESDSRVNQA